MGKTLSMGKMKKSNLCKLSIACAVCCGVVCGVAVSPLVVVCVLALVALICMLMAALVIIAGFFVWIFSGTKVSIFGYAATIADFAGGLFSHIAPVANFSFRYLTPVAGWIAVALGVLGIVISSVAISKPKKNLPQETTETDQDDQVGTGKKKKKKRTEKGICKASLIACIVLSLVALIAVIVSYVMMSRIS